MRNLLILMLGLLLLGATDDDVVNLTTSSPVAASGTEARCTELGGNCECSEPMDVANTTGLVSGFDFPDSPDATECDQFQAYFGTNNADITTATEALMPAGNSVSRVLEIPSTSGAIVWLRGRMSVDSSIKRTCIRYYKLVTPDYSGTGPNGINCPSERNKIIQFQFGSSQIQMQERADGSVCTGPGTGNDYAPITLTNPAGFGNFDLSPRVDWGDCNENTGWCRIEACATGNLSDGTNIRFEANVRTLSDGVDHFAEQLAPFNPGVPMQADTAGDLFHGQGQGGIGTEWISHFMQASWTTDAGQFIGPACEIEGGCP